MNQSENTPPPSLSEQGHCAGLAFHLGAPDVRAVLRRSPDDFQVDEVSGFELSGEGEHAFLHIRKRQLNTDDVVKRIARLAGVQQKDIGIAGMKDRNAVTTQWFSVWLPGQADPDWQLLNDNFITVLQSQRHQQKLRRGALKENRFVITLTDVQGDHQTLEQRLQNIRENGVPNYFGEQRFGRDEANLSRAADMFARRIKVKNRQLRSLYLSSARSLLFNLVLSKRVADGSWQQALPGDVMMLNGSRSFFPVDEIDDTIARRVREFDIHASGPLWGRGQLPVAGEVAQLELGVAGEQTLFCEGLENAGLKQERRALRLLPRELDWQWLDDGTLQLRFGLPSGTYATSVLRECIDYREE